MKIGIDLGTTNSALAYIDEREAEDRDFPPLHIFETPQLVAAGRVEARRTLPSFLYLEEGQPVGAYAREQGALVPTKLVHSAKSWLSNPDVDRTAKILPWDSQETGRVLSTVLVCDVGGGTSDFSLIKVSRDGDMVNFTRTAVGKHLLLGGDNLDLTLAWLVETKLGAPLSIRQRSGLRRQCSAAKERLLNDPHLNSVEITVLGAGASIVGGSLKAEILREEALELAL